MSPAARSQSTKKSRAFGLRTVNRATFGGCTVSAWMSQYNARASLFDARMSRRPLWTSAGASVIASRTC
ncbi:MAG: hypothetical protein QOJ18_25 [Microbacteriaceae bacterium]|nr:hypothetical protein [Microbacteriaceae bacterium]